MIMRINGKVSDLFFMDVAGTDIEHDGYVPNGLGIGGGDYIDMEIDTDTGQILNWKPLSEADIREAIKNA